jgi:hypothetical protein
MKKIGLLAFVILLLTSCDHWQEQRLPGKWQVVEATEDGMPLEVDLNAISFEFFKTGHYNFTSTLNYKESGTFSVRNNLLYTLDTINEASSEKAVKILLLESDTLVLKMNEEGKERVVKLFKVE